jgi:hypothetical protein
MTESTISLAFVSSAVAADDLHSCAGQGHVEPRVFAVLVR